MAEARVDSLVKKKERPSMKYRLNIIVKYRCWGEHTVDEGTPCDFEIYMKWKYVLNNPTMFQTKRHNLLRKRGARWTEIERVYIDKDKGLVIDFGNLGIMSYIIKLNGKVQNLRHIVMEEILSGTDALHINSFQTGGVDRVEVSRQMMEKSENLLRHQLWCFADENEERIHYVCPRGILREVKTLIDDLIVVEKQIKFGLVFFEVFKFYNVTHEAGKILRIKMDIDRLESKGKCIVTMTGSKLQVQVVENWLKENYGDNFIMKELSFKDIRGLEDTNIEAIVDEYLREQAYEHVFWCVDGKKGRICICAPTAHRCDKITVLLKRLKRQTLPDKFHQIICEMKEVKERRVKVRRIRGTNEMEVIGLKADLDRIKSIMSETTRKPEMSQSSDKRVNDGDSLANKSNNPGSVDVKHGKVHGKEALTPGQTNEVPDRELVQSVPFPVRDPSIFRILCNFAKLKIFALELGVVLEVTEGSSKGFLIRGGQSQCISVKHRK